VAKSYFLCSTLDDSENWSHFLLSKYKNTFIWIKMYTVENAWMHSLGVCKDVLLLSVLAVDCLGRRLRHGLGACELGFLECSSFVPFWSPGFAQVVSKRSQHPSATSPNYGHVFILVPELPKQASPQNLEKK
jgi:hypothetical protein